MSTSQAPVVIDRIKIANAGSPIAVFTTEGRGIYEALFASTVKTKEMIDTGHPALLGVFHGDEGVAAFKDIIKHYV